MLDVEHLRDSSLENHLEIITPRARSSRHEIQVSTTALALIDVKVSWKSGYGELAPRSIFKRRQGLSCTFMHNPINAPDL